MSNGSSEIPLQKAMDIGSAFISDIHMTVSNAVIAGSVRRKKEYVHDIEIVASPIIRSKQATLLDYGSENGTGGNLLHEHMQHMEHTGMINRARPRKDMKSNPFGPKYYRINYKYKDELSGEYSFYPIDLITYNYLNYRI